MLKLAGESGGEEILKAVRLASPVAADYERDYRKLQTMDIKALSQWGQ